MAYHFDPSTGQLAQASSSSLPNSTDSTFFITPDGKSAFIGDLLNKTFAMYSVDANSDQLSQVPIAPQPSIFVTGLITDPSGRFLYVMDARTDFDALATTSEIYGYVISSTGLTALPGSPFSVAHSGEFTMDASGKLLFVIGSNHVSGFIMNADGALSPIPGSPFSVRDAFSTRGTRPSGLVGSIDPKGQYLFIGDDGAIGQFRAYSIDGSGGLTPVPGTPIADNLLTGATAITPDGRFLYLTNWGFGDLIIGVELNRENQTFKTFEAFNNPPGHGQMYSATIDPLGRYLLTTNDQGIEVFQIDPQSGILTPTAQSQLLTGFQPNGLILAQ